MIFDITTLRPCRQSSCSNLKYLDGVIETNRSLFQSTQGEEELLEKEIGYFEKNREQMCYFTRKFVVHSPWDGRASFIFSKT